MAATTHKGQSWFQPVLFLRLEGLVALAGAVVAYWRLGGDGLLFAILLFVPDISMIGYRWNHHRGADIYNLAHTYIGPALLLAVGLGTMTQLPVLVALIWIAHIGLDRLLGYGLKYSTGFKDTHLSRHIYESLSSAGQSRGDNSAGA
ncbi:MAG: DUF4260 domain-containing protein [Chloroflexota bacterium]